MDDEAAAVLRTPDRRVDFGLLAKVPNPFNPNAFVLIIAGVHALGTLGAAEYLRLNKTDLENEMSQDYFALIVRTYRDDPAKEPDDVESVLHRGPIRIPASSGPRQSRQLGR